MAPLETVAQSIIREQELVIGPLAWSEAQKVSGLAINAQSHDIKIEDADPKSVIDRLVSQYERLFGRASHEVCREAASALISGMARDQVPTSLLA